MPSPDWHATCEAKKQKLNKTPKTVAVNDVGGLWSLGQPFAKLEYHSPMINTECGGEQCGAAGKIFSLSFFPPMFLFVIIVCLTGWAGGNRSRSMGPVLHNGFWW